MHRALPIVFESEDIVVIDKPPGLLTHRTKISEDTIFALQILRKQLGYRIHPIHRLDRATSGLLLFAKNSTTASTLGKMIQQKELEKIYLTVVRGYVDKGIMERALFSEKKNKMQDAETHYECLDQCEQPWEISRYPTSRYSLVKVQPITGRHQQIRKHFAQIRHPIIGDRRHGDVKHNNYWRDNLGRERLWLHAWKLNFDWEGGRLELEAKPNDEWLDVLKMFEKF